MCKNNCLLLHVFFVLRWLTNASGRVLKNLVREPSSFDEEESEEVIKLLLPSRSRLAREIKPETKYCYNYNNAGVSASNSVGLKNGGAVTDGHYVSQYPICAVSEGGDVTNRTGRKIKIKSVRLKYFSANKRTLIKL